MSASTIDANVSKLVYQDTLSTGKNYLDRRHALVGANCMVNRLNTTVSVVGGISHLEYLVDKNLDNGASFANGVKAEIGTEPTFTVRDVKHVYAKGTTAGFVVSIDNSVLKAKVVDVPMKIFFYKDGKEIASVSCEQKQGSLLNLQLASYSNNTLEFTAKAPADFDEIGLGSVQALKADVVGVMTVKYAFVGKNGKYFIDSEKTNGIEDFKEAVKKAYPGTTFDDDKLVLGQCITDAQKTPDANGNTIDDNPDNSVDVITKVLLSVWTPVTVSAYGGAEASNLPFKKGMTVGFETAGAGILDVGASIKLHPYIMTPSNKTGWFASAWNWQEAPKGGNDGDFSLLGVDLGGGRKDIITTLTEDCNAVELKAVSVLGLGATVAYRMFVVLPPSIDADDTLRVSAAQTICEDAKDVVLKSNRPVTWQCTSDNGKNLKLNDAADHMSCMVSGFVKGGTYTFEATDDTTKATRTTTVNYGVQRLYNTTAMPWVNNFTDPSVSYSVMTNDDMRKKGINGFTLIKLDNQKDTANLVNGSVDDYMSYVAGLQLAGSTVIAAVQRSVPLHLDKRTVVGFVLKFPANVLSVDLLNSMKVYAYNGGGKELTVVSRDHNFKLLQADLANTSQETTTEFNVELEADQDVDELLLCNNTTLNLDLSKVQVYYAFSEDATDAQKFAEEQAATGEIVSYNNGARIDETLLGGFGGVATVVGLKENYTNFIDGNLDDYLSVANTVSAAGKFNVIPVKLGKIYSGKHLVEITMGNIVGLANVDAAKVFKIDAYLNGQKVAEKTDWNTLDAKVVGTGGKYTVRWTPNADFDEIVIRDGGLLEALKEGESYYGMRIFSDADADGIPDYEDDESCPTVAFLVDENETALNKTHDYTNTKMYLNRSFAQGMWTTICLPVDMTYNQFAATFGSKARLAKPADFRTNTPNFVQFYIDKTYGNNVLLHKNTPYIIKVDNISDETIDSNIAADNGSGTLADEKAGNEKNMTGSDYVAAKCYLVHGMSYDTAENDSTVRELSFAHTPSNIWEATRIAWHGTYNLGSVDAGFYSFLLKPTSGDAEMVYVNGDVNKFRGLRCYMTDDHSINFGGSAAKRVPISVGDEIISGDTVTGISELSRKPMLKGNVYTLSGMLVRRGATTTDGLEKGIYIWNNKKIEVK